MTIQPINAGAVHFRAVLSENQFEIPQLQRPYAWDEDQVMDFINDVNRIVAAIRGSKGDGSDGQQFEHLFGTVVVLSPKNVGGRVSVIDGQQRLTTVSITLALIEHEMRLLANQVEGAGGPQADAIVRNLQINAQQINDRLWRQGVDANQPPEIRLETSPEISATYRRILDGATLRSLWSSPSLSAPAVKLLNAAEQIQDKLIQHDDFYEGQGPVQKQRHLVWLMNVILDQLLFVLVSTPSHESAYDLFEVLNARGAELNTLDLLKTWIMATMAEDPRRNEVYGKLVGLVENPTVQLEFLDDFFRARIFKPLGDDSPIAQSRKCREDLFKSAQPVEEVRNNIVQEIGLMYSWYPKWFRLYEVQWPYDTGTAVGRQSLESLLSILSCKIARPLLLQACARLDVTTFEGLLHHVEKVFFRYKTVCSRPVGPLEAVFYRLGRIIDTNAALDLERAGSELQTLLDQYAGDQVFKIRLDEFVYQPGATAKRIKYFLWTLDRHTAHKPAPMALDLSQYEIEHVAPQTPSGGRPALSNVNSLGNLCILTDTENQKLSNKDFAEKLEIVGSWKRERPLPIELTASLSRKIFEDHTVWSENEVDRRNTSLKKMACKVFRTAERDEQDET
jgi:hypothetical protein